MYIRRIFSFAFLITLALGSHAQVTVSSFAPQNIIGGIGQAITINGSGFGNQQDNDYVTFVQESGNYMGATEARDLKYISWSDTKIELTMPNAYSGLIRVNIDGKNYQSKDTIYVKANLGYRTADPLDYNYLTNQNGKGGYTWYMHRTYWENPDAKAAIEDVFREFRCKTGVNFILGNGPSDAKMTLNDTVNLIAPDASLNVAGYHYLLWNSCIVGSTEFFYAKSMDIGLSTTEDWYYGTGQVPANKAKFRYVLMHELGHALGLEHVDELGQTMYPSVTLQPSDDWCERDSITTEEQLAMTHMVLESQNFSFNGCGISPMLKVYRCNDIYGLSTSIAEPTYSMMLSVYPNPGDGNLKLMRTGDFNEPLQIDIYNLLGEKIYTETLPAAISQASFSLRSFPKGIYILRASSGNYLHSEKIITQ